MATIVWPGEPGESFTNDTSKILYQRVCTWHNTCGACAQYHLAIAKWWSPLHIGCACLSIPVYPGKTGRIYEDWREIVEDLTPDQQKELVGASNWRLLQAGKVDWQDIVTSTRVRSFQEVVSREKLTVDQMLKAGVKPNVADRAWASVNTPEHILADQQRAELIDKILRQGAGPKTLAEMFGDKMAQRIVLEGPSGRRTMPPTKDDEGWTNLLVRAMRFAPHDAVKLFDAMQTKAKAKAKEEPQAPEFKQPITTKAQVEKELGLKFTSATGSALTTVLVDVSAVDRDLAQDKTYYVARGGTGAAIEGRYEGVREFIAKAKTQKIPFQQSRLGLDSSGVIHVEDGRHRWAYFRDMGIRVIPVSVPRYQKEAVLARYGAVAKERAGAQEALVAKKTAAEEKARLKAEAAAKKKLESVTKKAEAAAAKKRAAQEKKAAAVEQKVKAAAKKKEEAAAKKAELAAQKKQQAAAKKAEADRKRQQVAEEKKRLASAKKAEAEAAKKRAAEEKKKAANEAKAKEKAQKERVAAAKKAAVKEKAPKPAKVAAVEPVPVPRPAPQPAPEPTPAKQPAPPSPTLAHQDRNIAEASRYARSLGHRLQAIDRQAMQARGYTEEQIREIPAFYSARQGALFVNPLARFWVNPALVAADAERSKWWSSGKPLGVIDHEVGHAKHHAAIGEAYLETAALRQPFDSEVKALVRRQVSIYGATSPVEMVAEVQAGYAAGKRYSREVMDLYKVYGGPPLGTRP